MEVEDDEIESISDYNSNLEYIGIVSINKGRLGDITPPNKMYKAEPKYANKVR